MLSALSLIGKIIRSELRDTLANNALVLRVGLAPSAGSDFVILSILCQLRRPARQLEINQADDRPSAIITTLATTSDGPPPAVI